MNTQSMNTQRKRAARWISTLAMTFVLAFAAAGSAQAESPAGDYVRMNVPDVGQAVDFLHQAMSCEVINSGADGSPQMADMALLDCGYGVVVEVSTSPVTTRAPKSSRATATVEFPSADAVSAASWLRQRGAKVGEPTRMSSGPDAGRIVVDVVAPWGQSLRLVSWSTANPAGVRPDGVGLAVD
jgi:hypothetical protein